MSEKEIPVSIVNSISNMIDKQATTRSTRELIEDISIKTHVALLKALKMGQVPGNAVIEWKDDQGPLRLNIIDFITENTVKASDPSTGEEVPIKTTDIPDGTWRLLY
jgi:hypothetical protein